MSDSDRFEKILFKVLDDLSPFLPSLILIGGWVPFFYRNHLWKLKTMEPPYTTDIDIGIPAGSKNTAKKTIYSQLSELDYAEKHFKIGHLFPIAFHAVSGKKYERIPVEFITGEKTSKATIESLLGAEVLINRVDHFDLLVQDPLSIRLSIEEREVLIQIPSPERYVIHKLLIYPERDNPQKAGKDAFAAYFVLRFHPERQKLMTAIKSLNLKKTAPEMKQILSDFFDGPSSTGILQVEKEIGAQISIPNLRHDIFEVFEELKNCL